MHAHTYGALLATSFFLALGFFIPYVGEPLALVGFIPLLLCLSKGKWSYKKSFFTFFLSGMIFFGATLAWMFVLLPLEWAGVASVLKAYGLFVPGWLLIVALFAFWWGVFGVGAAHLLASVSKHSNVVSAVCIAALWVLCEYARSFMVGFLGFSPAHGSLFSEWTFGSLVYAMTDGWMVLLASVGGLHLVNFVIMMCNGLIFLWWSTANTKKKRVLGGVTILAGVLGLTTLGGMLVVQWHERIYRLARSYEIAAMRTDIPRSFSYSPDARLLPMQESINAVVSLPEKIDVLVAPETANVLSFDALGDMRLIHHMKKDGTTLVDHAYARQADGLASRTVYWTPDSGIIGFQGKHILMPVGEYLPSLVKTALGFFGYQYVVDAYESARTLAVSEKGPPVTDTRGSYASVVCSEASNPDSIRSLVQAGAHVVFLQTSDSLFRGNYFYARYMISMARVRAIETGRFVVRASNAGPTAIIDSVGRVRALKNDGNGVVTMAVPFLHIITPYVRWRAWFVP